MAKAYILPFVLYLLGTTIISRFGDAWYPLSYSLLVGLVAGVAYCLLRGTHAIRPHMQIGHGIWIGLLGIGLWIGLSHLHLEQRLATLLPAWLSPDARVAYNPFEQLATPLAIWSFLAVRTVGLALLVPLVEEVFWRGFLLRWTIDPEWEKVPLGEYTWGSCMIVTAMFTLAHPEWLAAAVYCLLLNGLLYWKRDLWLCIVAHAVSNFALAIYVLWTESWWLW